LNCNDESIKFSTPEGLYTKIKTDEIPIEMLFLDNKTVKKICKNRRKQLEKMTEKQFEKISIKEGMCIIDWDLYTE